MLRPEGIPTVRIIGAASGWGAPDRGCEDGPDVLRTSEILLRLQAENRCAWERTLTPRPNGQTDPMPIVTEFCGRLSAEVLAVRAQGHLPVVMGGDHSCAVATWSAVREAQHGLLGLVWIDAHMDSHTPQTTLTGAIHGMSVAALLGFGDRRLTGLIRPEPKLHPPNVCLVGVRSFEEAEAALLRQLGVRVFFMDEIRRRGLGAVLAEAIAIARAGTAGFGVSLDLDVVDPADAPGVCTPAADGIRGGELAERLTMLRGAPGLAGLEIVEFNPHLDHGGKTARLAGELLAAILPQA